jgi:hypothetical protein
MQVLLHRYPWYDCWLKPKQVEVVFRVVEMVELKQIHLVKINALVSSSVKFPTLWDTWNHETWVTDVSFWNHVGNGESLNQYGLDLDSTTTSHTDIFKTPERMRQPSIPSEHGLHEESRVRDASNQYFNLPTRLPLEVIISMNASAIGPETLQISSKARDAAACLADRLQLPKNDETASPRARRQSRYTKTPHRRPQFLIK